MLSSKVGHSLDPLVLKVYRLFCGKRNIRPNILTVIGLFFALASAACIAANRLVTAGFLLLAAGLFDILDGVVARSTHAVTPFGGFFDSVLDRYSDLSVMLGVLLLFLDRGDVTFVFLTGIASLGVAIIPYARARAEAAGIACRNGLLERPERLLLVVVGLLFNVLGPVVLILAALTHVTVIQRIFLVRKTMGGQKTV